MVIYHQAHVFPSMVFFLSSQHCNVKVQKSLDLFADLAAAGAAVLSWGENQLVFLAMGWIRRRVYKILESAFPQKNVMFGYAHSIYMKINSFFLQ